MGIDKSNLVRTSSYDRSSILTALNYFLLTDRYLDEVSELACLDNPESYAGESLVLLVGPPKPDRSKDRGQTRYDSPPPPTCRFVGLA